MATQQEVIKKFMKVLGGISNLDTIWTPHYAVDEAFKKASEGSARSFNSMQDVMDSFLRDFDNAPSGDDFLTQYCGINLENEDSGSITGLDAGGSKVKTDASIVPENTALIDLAAAYRKDNKGGSMPNDVVVKDGNLSFTKRGLTVSVPDYDDIITKADEGNELSKLKSIVNCYIYFIYYKYP